MTSFKLMATKTDAQIIIDEVCDFYKVAPYEIFSRRRTDRIAWARHVAVWLMRQLTEETYLALGQMLNRDHSTMINSYRAVWDRRDTDEAFCARLDYIMERLSARLSHNASIVIPSNVLGEYLDLPQN